MKDPTKQLHVSIYELLNGAVQVNGTEVEVCKWSRPGTDMRVTIGTTTMEDDSTHDTYILEVQQEVLIQAELSFGDERDYIEDISDQVVQLVIADTFSTMTDFYTTDIRLSSVEVFEEEFQDTTIYVKELTFKYNIAEN